MTYFTGMKVRRFISGEVTPFLGANSYDITLFGVNIHVNY